jgi:hypothetical protein
MVRTVLLTSVLLAILALTACGAAGTPAVSPTPVPAGGLEAAALDALTAWAGRAGAELERPSFTIVENDGANATIHAGVMLRDDPEAAWLGYVADLYFGRSGDR